MKKSSVAVEKASCIFPTDVVFNISNPDYVRCSDGR